jgi:hypothetical protein
MKELSLENENKDLLLTSRRVITRGLDLTQIRWSEEFEPGNKVPKTIQFPSVDQISKLVAGGREEIKKLELVGISFAFLGFARLNFLLSNGMESNLKVDERHEQYSLPTDYKHKNAPKSTLN